MKETSQFIKITERFRRTVSTLLPVLLLLTVAIATAQAGMQAAGPVSPLTTLPIYYQDTNSPALALMPCLDQNGFCILPPPFDPAIPPVSLITTTGPINDTNLPGEGFYYSADTLLAIDGGELAKLTFVLEYAFLGGVIPNTGITFLRTDLQKMRALPPNTTYRVTHPYGTFTFQTDALGNTDNGGGAIRFEDQAGVAADWLPPLFRSAPVTNMGPFLKPASGILPTAVVNGQTHTYLGDPAVAVQVTGSPTGNNFVRYERLNALGNVVATFQTDQFLLMGRVYTDQIPSPLNVDRVTYARDAASGQVDIFASASTAATLSVSGTGIPATTLTRDFPNTGKFFATIPFASLPTGLVLTNSRDIPPIPYPLSPGDEILVSQAYYNPVAKSLTIRATSRDKVAPLPTLSVPAFAPPNTLDASGTLVLPIAANTIPPQNIQVVSSHGGSATASVSVVTPPAAPVAVNDAASTAAATAVTVDVLLNDTTAAALDATSVRIVTPSADGGTVINPSGAVTFTPNLGFSGTASFAYDVRDIFGQLSNTATVSITVAASPAPVALPDSASTPQDTAAIISVLANDVGPYNAASVAIVTAPVSGSAVANANGTITYTPAAGFTGSASFTYTVANSATPSLTSNAALVSITVTPPAQPPAPVAVNDTASTQAGSAVTIPVLANDTIGAPGVINVASVLIATPSLNGTAVPNVNGTITFTPNAGFTGSTSFSYTVDNSSAQPLRSNAATVTVNVTAVAPAPVAVNNTATTTAGSPVTINVLANDTIAAPGVINVASVQIGTQSLNGTAVANASGTITFTPAAGFSGTTTFTYSVANSSTPALRSNFATVTVTVNALAAQTIAVSRAQFTLSSAAWRIDGTLTPAPPAGTTLTIYNTALVGGAQLITNVAVGANGSFTWSSPNGAPAPNAARRISIQSVQNPATKLENVTVTVR
jgi:hypothetical protein